MATIEEKLARSLSSEGVDIIPYLPYLLQDLWELGSSPRDMLEMVKRHLKISSGIKVLDLACGKGAVSILLTKELGCRMKGIDIVPEFIAYAEQKALAWGVDKLCTFSTGDITQSVHTETGYDLVILGAVGDVLGNPEETIVLLKKTLKKGGYILIDDAYGNDPGNEDYYNRTQWLRFMENAGVELVDEKPIKKEEITAINQEQQAHIIKRARELKEQRPEDALLFDRYIQSQQSECDELENEITGVTLLLRTRDENCRK
ncbi:MAG: methyltransferase domain-containing protein [Eubacteriales bacterium]|nr:methyltransferase domain-containing protein [Eubacteriales bacterium]MDD4431973.1 methyltransferase domain-containing protein [Bacteroidales bacterium]